jgi:tetratricopeptide (TPR) repeat protein
VTKNACHWPSFFEKSMTSPHTKMSRNDRCPCGSGKKFKHCCAAKDTDWSLVTQPDIEHWQRQAQQAVAQGNYRDAEACFRQLIKIKPNDAYFLASLGQALCWLQKRREGVDYLLKAAKHLQRQASKNKEPRFLVELSAQLLHWGEVVVAEQLARLAVKLTPKSAVALNNLAMCLTRANRNAEALPISQQVCQLLPDHPGCNILLALLEAKLIGAEAALSRLNRVIERNEDAEQTARAQLEKAVILDKLGHYDEAFATLVLAGQGHSALSPMNPVERETIFVILERNRQGFDKNLLQRWPKQTLIDDGLPVPAFLLGFLRSGTTLTEQVLGAHPGIIATDESGIIHELTLELQRISGISDHHASALAKLNLAQIKQLRQFYWQRMREEFGDQVMHKQLVDKNALNTIDLGVISVIFPEAKILFALRDPRDVCLSCFMQAFSLSPATINLTSWSGIARQYAAVMDYWLAIRDIMQPAYLQVLYENTVNDYEASFRQVFEFLGLEWFEAVTQYHERNKGRYISTPSFAAVSQPIYNTAVRRWLNYQTHVKTVESQLQPFVDAFGYNETWKATSSA